MSKVVLGRALVILGLREGGLAHLEAVRIWLRWECELSGELCNPEAMAWIALGNRADRAARQALRDYEQTVSLTNRRTWRALGLTPEFALPD